MKLNTTLIVILITMVLGNNAIAQDLKGQVLTANQVAKLDLNGKWSGKRMQYSADKKSFVEIFQYEFDLVQQGNIVTGTSTIMSQNGDFADMQLEGVLIGNKLYFREFQVKNAIRPEGKVWCFKSGELNFVRDGDNIKLAGATASYMEYYNYPCSGGVTDLSKVDNSANIAALNTATPTGIEALADNKLSINTYPNPFIDNANINYTLTESAKINVEVYDMQGKQLASLFDGNQNAGSYNINFNAKNVAANGGVYIVKMTVNGEVYSSEIVQMK